MKAGFTLLEMLTVMAVSVAMTGAIIASVSSGLRVWRAVEEGAAQEASAWPGLELFEKDAMNSVSFRGIPFVGTPREISFAIVQKFGGGGAEGEGVARLGTVRYSFDEDARALVRHVWPFPEDPGGPHAQGERVIDNVESLVLQYAPWPSEGTSMEPGLQWNDEWTGTDSEPMAVRVELRIRTLDRSIELSRDIVSPLCADPEENREL